MIVSAVPKDQYENGALPVASGKIGAAHTSMYERIELTCECGWQPTRLREVGLTVDRQLVIYWRCSNCRRQMYRVKPLAECWQECPAAVPDAESEAHDSVR